MGVPTNKLHACGYISIGCEPCTRPVLPNQHEREGRWWWEDSAAVSPRPPPPPCRVGPAAAWARARLFFLSFCWLHVVCVRGGAPAAPAEERSSAFAGRSLGPTVPSSTPSNYALLSACCGGPPHTPTPPTHPNPPNPQTPNPCAPRRRSAACTAATSRRAAATRRRAR